MEQTENCLNPLVGLSSSEALLQLPSNTGTNTTLVTMQDLAVMELIVDEVYACTPSSEPPLPSPTDRASRGLAPQSTPNPKEVAGAVVSPPEPNPPRAWSPSALMPTAPTPGAPFFIGYRESQVASPASSNTMSMGTPAEPGGRTTPPALPRIEIDTPMPGPNSPESEESSSPNAPCWEDTQTRDACYLLAQTRALCSQRQPIPFELDLQAISNHTGDLALEITAGLAWDFNPKRV